MPQTPGSSPEEEEELKSSSTNLDNQDEGEDSSTSNQDDNGGSSDPKDEGPSSVLEAVEAAIKKTGEQSSSSDKEGQEAEDQSAVDAKKKEGEGDVEGDGEDGDLPPFHKHPRWIEVQQELKGTRPKAKAFDQLTDYIAEAELTTEEVNDGMEIMRLMKKDPLKALEALQPYVTALQETVGHLLPEDLRKKVDDGLMDEDSAKELASARARENMAKEETRKAKEAADRRVAQTQASEQQRVVTDLQSAASTWEEQWKASDPDYAVLQPRVMEKIELRLRRDIQSGKFPTSVQAVRDLCEECKKEALSEVSGLKPKKREIKPSPGSGGGTVKANAEPESILDIVKMNSGGA